MSHYDTIKESYLKRKKHETECIAAAKLLVRKLANYFGWPDEQKHIGALSHVGNDEHVVDGNFAFNKHGRLRWVAEFAIDAESPPAHIECHLEKAASGAWFVIVAGVQHTFDLYGMRLLPDDISHAFLAAIKRHFEPAYQIVT